ncbi:hypothetical protein ACLI1A_13030 [Flavobacterium sp. RHBU_3]|uniref:hypothetical protein n=1 Tax=Flavobacterium sp. RHBU_3 TaxID=3391184 RepID=UPI0039850F75
MKKVLLLLLCVATTSMWAQDQSKDYVEYIVKGKMETVTLHFPLKSYVHIEGHDTWMMVNEKKVKINVAAVPDYDNEDAGRNTPTDILNNYMIKDKKPGASLAELYTRKTEILATKDNKIMAFWYNENPQGQFPSEIKVATVAGNSIIQFTLLEPMQDIVAYKRLLIAILNTADLQAVAVK